MKFNALMFATLLVFSGASYSADQYVNANIERIEVCDTSAQYKVRLFLKNAEGTIPPSVDGCSNYGTFPYVILLESVTDLESRNPMLSLAITAYTTGKVVRIRYDEVDKTILSLALL